MPIEADAAAAAMAAIARQPRFIAYPEYSTKDDFTLWLSGYVARVRSEYGFKLDEKEELENEVVRSISGILSVGPALDAYNRLSIADKTSYDRLVARLTEEFIDPRAKKKFNARMNFNLRKKRQSLKDFMQDITTDMGRYSYLQPTVIDATGEDVPNPERELQGVRRFIEGIRNKNGKVDEDFSRHLEYHLQDEREMTWSNAIKIASRYEAVNNDDDADGDNASDDSNSDEEIESGTKKKTVKDDFGSDVKAIGSRKKKKSIRGKITISALSDQVEENHERICKIESALDRMAAAQEQLAVAQEATNAMMEEMMAKLDLCLPMAQGGYY